MLEGKLKFTDYEHEFYDDFGNKINNYIVEKYYKNSNDDWILEETIKTNAGNYFVVDGKFYFETNGSLIPLNMDFKSESCGACYKIVGIDITEYKRIIGNEYLCRNKYLGLKLHKQSYSDGTCFYALEDNNGRFRVNYANSDLSELIKVLERRIEINKRYEDICLPSMKEEIEQIRKLIEDINSYISEIEYKHFFDTIDRGSAKTEIERSCVAEKNAGDIPEPARTPEGIRPSVRRELEEIRAEQRRKSNAGRNDGPRTGETHHKAFKPLKRKPDKEVR